MRLRLIAAALTVIAACTAVAAPKLVPIANTFQTTGSSSSPMSFFRVGSLVYFTAFDSVHGREPWRTDGTPAGTSLIQDIVPGSNSSDGAFVGAIGSAALYITGGSQPTVWRTDGTAAGTYKLFTVQVTDPYGYYVLKVVATGPRAFILVRTTYDDIGHIYVTDGTPAPARELPQVPRLDPSTASVVGLGGKLYFVGSDATFSSSQLWVSDGTASGTHMLAQNLECAEPLCLRTTSAGYLFVAAGMLHFASDQVLYRTDGTPGGTVKLGPVPTSSSIVASSDAVTYIRQSSSGAIYRVDANGISGGTGVVAFAAFRVLADGRLLALGGAQLMVTDGTAAHTQSIATVGNVGATGINGNPQPLLAVIGNRAIVSASFSTATGVELVSVDLTTGAKALVKDIDARMISPTSGYPSGPTMGAELDGRTVFPATNVAGRELWVSDGTTAGTTLLANIAPEVPTGAISGVVRDRATQAVLPDTVVSLCRGTCDDSTRTDANGFYRFDGVQPADDYVVIVASTPKYLRQDYDKLTCSTASVCTNTPLSVKAGFESTNIDFALDLGSPISGRVTAAADGAPLASVLVNIYNAAGKWVDQLATASDGTYHSRAFDTGTYYVFTDITGSQLGLPYFDQVYRGLDCDVACDWHVGDPIALSRGVEKTGVDFALRRYGRISGTVKDAFGQPAPSITVLFYSGETLVSSSLPTAAGTFLSPLLRPGTYTARASGAGYQTVTSAPVVVTSDTTTGGVDLVARPSGGTVVGRLVTQNGKVLSGQVVDLLPASTGAVPTAYTDAEGNFMFRDVAAGSYYVRAAGELYGGIDCPTAQCGRTGATAVQVTATEGAALIFTLTKRQLTISGVVTDSTSAAPLSSAYVTLYGGTATTPVLVERTYTSADGRYYLIALTRETSLRLSATEGFHHPRSYQNVEIDCATGCASATFLPAGDTFAIDLALRPYGSLSGTVTDALSGAPVSGASVSIGSGNTALTTVTTDSAGKYRVTGTQGAYYVWVASASGYTPQTYPGQNCPGGCPYGGTLVNAVDGDNVTGIDFSLAPSTAIIRARVLDDATGLPLSGIPLSAATSGTPGFPTSSGTTDANGACVLRLTANGSAQVTVNVGGLLNGPVRQTLTATTGTSVSIEFRITPLHISSIAPANGSIRGGTRVTINGTGFLATSSVTIGGTAATVVSASPNQIVATTPAGAAGFAHVAVTNSDAIGSTTRTLVQAFRYTNALPARSDFDGDGKSDMLWVNASSGDTWGWLMNGSKLGRSAQITTVTPTYQVQGIGDFDRDGKSDLVWIGPDGDAWIWLMNGLSIKSSSSPYTVAANYRVAGAGDFDGDGQSDLLWFNAVTGDTYLWLMNGSAIGTSKYLYTAAANYRVAGVGDFDGDGKSDIVWFNTATGDTYLWLMNGTTIRSSTYVYGAAANYAITGVGDFDGDGKADLVWFNNVTGDTYIWLMNGAAIARSSFIYQVANNFRIAGVGDFDGDGKSDLVWRNTSTGDTYVWLMDGTQFTSSTFIYAPTTQWKVPAPGAF